MLYASLTLAPSVRSVRVLSHSSFSPDAIALSRDEYLWKALADQLDPHSEVLTSFTITSWQFHGSVPAEVLGIVDKLCQKFTALTTLSVPKAFIPPAALQLPSRLEKLEVSIRSSVNPQGEMILPGLANLQLSVTSAEGCNLFLRSLRARNLDSLTIHYSSAVSTKNINLQDTFSALLASSGFPHLSSITVHGDKSGLDERFDPYFGIHPTPPTTFPITYGVLEPLMSCQGMTRITITNCILEISNNDLLRMLSAWPKLTVLKLASAFQVNNIPKLSLAGLHTALLRCPLLSHLDLPCDARTLPSAGAAPHPSLSCWNARGSPLETPKGAAKILQTCFPKLKVLRFFEDMCDKVADIDYDYESIDPMQVASFMHWRDVQKVMFGERT
ncbi:hypothetical protein BKA70DRAFT_1297169 [Coprinopsis sp. MPI-PUGE-AT-0042]|nr:hypothetical protein BKA70DRAFT_1297169 [Coprinopsis sp. MPI-PUGE-AT-0042]